jgi:hypothetical protein
LCNIDHNIGRYDEFIDAIKKNLVTYIERWNRAHYSIKDILKLLGVYIYERIIIELMKEDIHSSIPINQSERTHLQAGGLRKPGWALISSSCVVSKVVRKAGYTVSLCS